jgi:hypothetical protein
MARKFNSRQLGELSELDFGTYDPHDCGVVLSLAAGGQVWCAKYFLEYERRRGIFRPHYLKPYVATIGINAVTSLPPSDARFEFDDPITAAIWLITEQSNRLS